jgi:hypothetical protein
MNRLINQPINQPTKELNLGLFSHSCVAESLGSVTDTNRNWDCAYANEFPSRLKTPTWAN